MDDGLKKSDRIGGRMPALQAQRFVVTQVGAQPEPMVPGMVPGMSLPPDAFAMPKEPSEPVALTVTEPVMTVDSITRGLGIEPGEAHAFRKFLESTTANADNPGAWAQQVQEWARTHSYSPELRRALFARAQAYYKGRGQERPTALLRARRAAGARTESPVKLTVDLTKAEPRGGKYHARVPDPESGKHRYYYSEKAYSQRPDAHLRGSDILKDRARKELQNGATPESLADRYDSGMITDLVKEMQDAGALAKGPPPRLTMAPAAASAGGRAFTPPSRPPQVQAAERSAKDKILREAGLKKDKDGNPLPATGGDMEKSVEGEGSRGGKIIGHTSSGKPIYDSHGHDAHVGFSAQDHKDAHAAHWDAIKQKGIDSPESKAHAQAAQSHWASHQKGKTEEMNASGKQAQKLNESKGSGAAMQGQVLRSIGGNALHAPGHASHADAASFRKQHEGWGADQHSEARFVLEGHAKALKKRGKYDAALAYTHLANMHGSLGQIKNAQQHGGASQTSSSGWEDNIKSSTASMAHHRGAHEAAAAAEPAAPAKKPKPTPAKKAAAPAASPVPEGHVRIAMGGGKSKDVKSEHTAGLYHVHGTDEGTFKVTHGPSGMGAKTAKSKEEAVAFANHMHENAGDAGADTPHGKVPEKSHMNKIAQAAASFKKSEVQQGAGLEDWLRKAGAVPASEKDPDEEDEAAEAGEGGEAEEPGEADESTTPPGFQKALPMGDGDEDDVPADAQKRTGAAPDPKASYAESHEKTDARGEDASSASPQSAHLEPTRPGPMTKGTNVPAAAASATSVPEVAPPQNYGNAQVAQPTLTKGGGEGSRGGKIIGHTSGGKPIYASGEMDRAAAHSGPAKVAFTGGSYDTATPEEKSKHHAAQADYHTDRAKQEEAAGNRSGAENHKAIAEQHRASVVKDHALTGNKGLEARRKAERLEADIHGKLGRELGSAGAAKLHGQAADAHREAALHFGMAGKQARESGDAKAAAEYSKMSGEHGDKVGHHTKRALEYGMGKQYAADPTFKKSEDNMNGLSGWLVKAGIPGAEDIGGGKPPADDLPSGESDIDQGKDVNGGLSQAGAEGGNLEPGKGSGERVERTGPGKEAGVSETAGSPDTGGTEKLSKDDGPMGKLPEGEPGMVEESGAGLSGNDQMDVGSMKKGDLDNYHAPPDWDAKAAKAHAMAIRKAQSPTHLRLVGGKAPVAKPEPQQQPMVKSLNGVPVSDASDLAVERMLKSGDYYGGGGPSSMNNVGAIGMSKMCKSCDGPMPVYLTACPTCGVGETVRSVQTPASAGGMAKSLSPFVSQDLRLPNGFKKT